MFRIYYGTINTNIDVTEICYNKLIKNNIIFIPDTDEERADLFGDPLVNRLKTIFIRKQHIFTSYQDNFIFIDTVENTIYTNTDIIPYYIKSIYPFTTLSEKKQYFESKLKNIHEQLKIDFGSFNEEYPEQMMAVSYLTGNEKVLEIGGNIGRNSLVIAHILNKNNNNNFVSLECDTNISQQLIHNKDLNQLDFFVENSALSKRNLIQQDWDTIPSDVVLDGYTKVNTITLEQLNNKYNIEFDTIVLDCEGAFYYILMDMPEILNNIKLIIMENDYWDITEKEHVDNVLIKNGFKVDYSESGGWGPCYDNFFEVWKKT
jgi:FkbM family methyltransferase